MFSVQLRRQSPSWVCRVPRETPWPLWDWRSCKHSHTKSISNLNFPVWAAQVRAVTPLQRWTSWWTGTSSSQTASRRRRGGLWPSSPWWWRVRTAWSWPALQRTVSLCLPSCQTVRLYTPRVSPRHSVCTVYTVSVHSVCIQCLYTVSVHSVCT